MDIEVYQTAKSVLENGSFGLEKKTLSSVKAQDGKYYVIEGLAVIIAAVPFVYISKLIGVSSGELVVLMNKIITPVICLLIFLNGRALQYSTVTNSR